MMEYRPLGSTGLTVSALGFGCGSVGGLMVRGAADEQRRAISRALEAGVTYFDTAPLYGDGLSETNLGRALADLAAWDRVVVGTKVRLHEADRGDPDTAIRRSLETSMRLLGRQSVDLLQLHNPISSTASDRGALPLAEVTGAVAESMRRVVAAGLVRHAGLTGLGEAAAVRGAIESGAFATIQAYFNAVNPSAGFAGAAGGAQDLSGIIDTAAGAGMGVINIRVMAAGALAGERPRPAVAGGTGGSLTEGGAFDADRARTARLVDLARSAGLESTVELAVRFGLSKPGISTVLVGFSDLEQLEEALRFTERGPLSDDVVRAVVTAAR